MIEETAPPIDECVASEAAHVPLSECLGAVAQNVTGDEIALREVIALFGNRGFAALLVLLALPSALPGASLLGIAIGFLGVQMMLGREVPWFPGWIQNKSIKTSSLIGAERKFSPLLQKLEKLCRPRWAALASPKAGLAHGLFIAAMGAFQLVPGPGSNQLIALAVLIYALGLGERDGVFIAGGIVTGFVGAIVALVISIGIYGSILFALFAGWQKLLGG